MINGLDVKKYIEECMIHARLSEREKAIISMRYGLDDGHQKTLDVIANTFGITKERARQIIFKIYRKMTFCIDDPEYDTIIPIIESMPWLNLAVAIYYTAHPLI